MAATVELAEGICEKLEGQLTCSICLESYTDPKFLRCHHYFCLKCLSKLLIQDDRQRFFLRCPACRTKTRIPNDNVAGLQPAFHVAGLKDIQESVKKITDLVSTAKIKCREHDERGVDLYCETCDIAVCFHCVIKSGHHCNHEYDLINDAVDICMTKIRESLVPDYERVIEDLRQLSLKLEAVVEQLQAMCDVAKLQESDWLEFLSTKIEDCKTQRAQVAGFVESLDSKMNRIPEFRNNPQFSSNDISLELCILLIQSYRDLASLIVEVQQKIDETQICTVLNPLKCRAAGEGLHVARVGKTATVEVYVACCTGSLQDVTRASIQCELELALEKVNFTVTKVDPNRYDVSYQLTATGEYLLNIKADHGHIQGSPFLVTVVDAKADIMGFPVMTLLNKTPLGVAVDRKGNVVVHERRTHGISTFTSKGERIKSFLTHYHHTLTSIATDEDDNVFLASYDLRRLFKVTTGGMLIDSLALSCWPKWISYNPCLRRIYLLNHCGCILTLSSDFLLCSNYWKQRVNANALACDMSGKVYTTCSHYIEVFTPEMKFIRRFGKFGCAKGELNQPFGITIDHRGIVYVSDLGNCRISLFTSTGCFLTSFGERGYGPGEFTRPHALAVSKNGVLYVCDYNNRSVQAFSCKHVPHKASVSDSLPGIIGAVMIAILMILFLQTS